MKNVLIALVIEATLVVSTAAIFSQPSYSAKDPSVEDAQCNVNTKTTEIVFSNGQKAQILHWGEASLPPDVTLNLCKNSAQKLLDYYRQMGDQDWYLASRDMSTTNGTVAVCIEKSADTCSTILFTLPVMENSQYPLSQINQVLDEIVDPDLKGSLSLRGDNPVRSGLGVRRILELLR
ncbi:MAG TPA: hypothetical protein DDZ80_03820 [Cyanobacteria bacterium UBA8803]|nr:hypothetical protein [Cyanobacteria bacterium UBA9273]HBL57691.1 hypothetical protein [Cyanobacteria bacterium UBA8803]